MAGLGLSALGATRTLGAAASTADNGSFVFSSLGGNYSAVWNSAVAVPFAAQSGISVSFNDVPGQTLANLQAQEGAHNVTWSLAELGSADYLIALKSHLIQPLPVDLQAALKKVSRPGWTLPYGAGIGAGATQVIAVNGKTVTKRPKTPAEFFDTKNFPGRRAMWQDGYVQNMATALLADGVPANKLFPLDINRALKVLSTIKPQITTWYTSGAQQQQLLSQGEVDMLLGWDGRMFQLINQGIVDIRLSFQGGLFSPSVLVVPVNAPNTAGALSFIKYWANNPQAQAGWTSGNGYPAANPASLQYVTKKVRAQLWTNPGFVNQMTRIDVNHLTSDLTALKTQYYNWLQG